MSEPFLGEIRLFGFNFPPRGWAQCDGAILPINQYQSLYSILGTTYGGDGRTTFALPDLRGRLPLHFDSGHPLGSRSGQEQVTLTLAELPAHQHGVSVANARTTDRPGAAAHPAPGGHYGDRSGAPGPQTSASGAGQSHLNLPPALVVNFCIALQGIFPSRS